MNKRFNCSIFLQLPIAFCMAALGICLLSGMAFAAPMSRQMIEKAYEDSKNILQRLVNNPRAVPSREPWRKLSDNFFQIYTNNPLWKNRPAALYRAGLTLEEMIRRTQPSSPKNSTVPDAEAHKAIAFYEQLISAHPASVLVDDALFHAARLKAEYLNDHAGAIVVLKRIQRDFAKGDMARNAQRYEKELTAVSLRKTEDAETISPDTPQKTPAAETPAALVQIAWQTKRNTVQIILDTDKPAQWEVSALPENRKLGMPPRLVVDIFNTVPTPQIKPGVKVTGSPLRRLRVDLSSPERTRLLLDFSVLKRFSARSEGGQLVVIAAITDNALPKGLRPGKKLSTINTDGMSVPSNLARQLGLSVGTVLLDPGHGGKDPGAEAEGIKESEVTLDLIRRVGDILVQNGLRIHYTRTDNTWISLEARSSRANEIKADIMVSVHVNASPNKSASGFETYYLNFANSSDDVRLAGVENAMSERKLGELEGLLTDLMLGARTQESRRLAETIQRFAIEGLRKKGYDTHNGGIKTAPFHVLLASGIPGVLVEVGYCTNSNEARRLESSSYRDVIAEEIAAGILSYAGRGE